MCKALEDELCENQAHTQDTTSYLQTSCMQDAKKRCNKHENRTWFFLLQ